MSLLPATANRAEIRRILDHLNFCGCNVPDSAWEALHVALAAHHVKDESDAAWGDKCGRLSKWFDFDGPLHGDRHLLAYFLDHHNLTEHGGSVGGAWLSEDGKILLKWLDSVKASEMDYGDAVNAARDYEEEG